MDSEILTLQVDINDNPMNEKVDSIEHKISTLKEHASQMLSGDAATQSIPGFESAFGTKLTEWQKDLDNILRVRKSMDHAGSSYERENLAAEYKRKIEVANASVKDLMNSKSLVQQILGSFDKSLAPVFAQGLSGIVTQLTAGIRQTAQGLTKTVGGKLTDTHIVDEFMKGPGYKNIVGDIQKSNPKVFSDAVMRQYLMSRLPMDIPQYVRQTVTGGSQVQFRKAPTSFREMLPQAFQNIPAYRQSQADRTLGSTYHGNETLSSDEITELNRQIKNNRILANAAVTAGVMTKKNGKMYFNHGTTHDMVNAMGGLVMDTIVTGAQGERKYGITNVEDGNFWKNIQHKIGNNKNLDMGLAAARSMQDIFPWLDPGRYKDLKPFDLKSGNAGYIGRVTHDPFTKSRAFAEYTLEMMQQGANVTGQHPVVFSKGQWKELADVTGPGKTKVDGKTISINPDDFHTISLRDSMLHQMVMSAPHASKVGHNEFDDNMIYLKFAEELGNPGLNEEAKEKYINAYGTLFDKGYTANGRHYSVSRIGKTHAEFIADDIIYDLGRKAKGLKHDAKATDDIFKAGMEVLSNGGGLGTYDEFKPFAKSMYNRSNMATEGERLDTWLGTEFGFRGNAETARRLAQAGLSEEEKEYIMASYGTPNMKVVVGNFGKEGKDMDGANLMNSRISTSGFQGRTFGGKATYVPIDMSEFRKINYKQIQENEKTRRRIAELSPKLKGEKRRAAEATIMDTYGGALVIPGAGVDGGDLLVDKDVDFIENTANIKHYGALTKGIKKENLQAFLNETRSRDYSRDGVYAKTDYDKSNTSSRWLSKQVINSSMNAGFRDPRVENYFNKVFFDEIARLDNDQYVRDALFQGDQTVDLNSKDAQKVIQDHVNGMFARFSEGDRLLPTGVFKYAMAAPNPQNVINKRLKEAGIQLTPEQKALELKENDVISVDSLAKQLGIIRFPATKSGNITANNIAALKFAGGDAKKQKKVQNLAKSLGVVDPKGLYFAPDSPILQLLQGEDFDGDLNGYFGLSDDIDPKTAKEFSEVMRIISNASNKDVKEIRQFALGSKGGGATPISMKKEGKYDLTDPYDMARYLVNAPTGSAAMSAAERSADMASLYYAGINNPNLRGMFAQAILDYEKQYDEVSTKIKDPKAWNMTEAQRIAASYGSSFSRLFKYANEAVQTTGVNSESQRVWNKDSFDYLKDKKIDKLGLPSIFQASNIGTLIARAQARALDIEPEGEVYDWNEILDPDRLALPEGVSKNSEQAKFVQMMRGVRGDFLTSKYLVASNDTVKALDKQYTKAVAEIEKSVDPQDKYRASKIAQMEDAIGGNALKAFKEFGWTEANVEKAPWIQNMLTNLAARTGKSVRSFYDIPELHAVDSAPVKITESKTLPQSAQNIKPKVVEPKKEVLPFTNEQPETADQEAYKLLKEAGIQKESRIATLLNKDNREALLNAVASGNIKGLLPLEDIGKSTATKAIHALQDSRLANIKTTSKEEMEQAVETVVAEVPKVLDHQDEEIEKQIAEHKQRYKSVLQGDQAPENYDETKLDYESVKGRLEHERKQTPWEGKYEHKDTIDSTGMGNPNVTKDGKTYDEYIGELEEQVSNLEELKGLYAKKQGIVDDIQQKAEDASVDGAWFSNQDDVPMESSESAVIQQQSQELTADIQRKQSIAQDFYAQIMDDATEFSRSLFGDTLKYQEKLKGTPQAISTLNRNEAFANRHEGMIRDFLGTEYFEQLDKQQQDRMMNLVSPEQGLFAKAGKDFSAMSQYNASALLENITLEESKAIGTYDAQIAALEAWDKKIDDVAQSQKRLLEMSENTRYGEKTRQQFKDAADAMQEDLNKITKSRANIGDAYAKENEKRFDQQIESLEDKLGHGNRYQKMSKQYQASITEIRDNLEKKHELNLISPEAYAEDLDRLKKLEQQSSESALRMQSAFDKVGAATSRAISRFGSQMFRKAIQEAQRFVQEFDKSMTEIQMITMKTDEQIRQLGSHLIDTALGSGSSVSDVTSAASNLYRQGLSDSEVDARLEDVLKFSKVAGIKTDEASKILTTAIQNDLVSNSEEAMDALVALGDTAATTASEIAKGMQKSAASAKQAGMSYGELVTLLTIGTSRTQLGGSTIGAALQTMIYRLYKVNSGEDFYDENGNHFAATDATNALRRMGISLFDEGGSFRGPYQILQDIATGWESADEITQSAILNTLGAGRQRSNVATLIQGLAADEGEIAGRYINTAENSQGITDRKYQAYLDSLEAKMTNVKTSWDQLVNSFNAGPTASGALDAVSGMIQGLTALSESANKAALAIPLVITAIAALGAAMKTNPVLAAIMAGVAVVGAIGTISNSVHQAQIESSPEYLAQQAIDRDRSFITERQKDIDRANALYEKAAENGGEISALSDSEQAELSGILSRLGANFGNASDAAQNLANNFSSVGKEIRGYQENLNEYKVEATKRNIASLPVVNNISDKIGDGSEYGIITPKTIKDVTDFIGTNDNEMYMDFFGFTRGYSNQVTGPDALKNDFAGGKLNNETLAPIVNKLLMSGETGVRVGSLDSYYKVLGEDSDDGKVAREHLYNELTQIKKQGYDYLTESYTDYLKEGLVAYAEKDLRDSLNAEGVFNSLQLDEIVETFISNVTKAIGSYDTSEIENLDLATLVAEEIARLTDQIFAGSNIDAGVAKYSELESKRLSEAADKAWENGNFVYDLNGTAYLDKEGYDAATKQRLQESMRPGLIAENIARSNPAWELDGNVYRDLESYRAAAKQFVADQMYKVVLDGSKTSEEAERKYQTTLAGTDWDSATAKAMKRYGKHVIFDPVSGQVFNNSTEFTSYVADHIADYSDYYQAADEISGNLDLTKATEKYQSTFGKQKLVDPVSGLLFSTQDEYKAYVMNHPSDYNFDETVTEPSSRVLNSIEGSLLSASESERSKVSADNLYKEIQSNVDAMDLGAILQAVEQGLIKSWDSVIQSSPEYGRLLNRYITDNGDGSYTVSDETGRGAGELMSLLATNSLSYTGILPEEFVSRSTVGTELLTAYQDWVKGIVDFLNVKPEDLSTVLGQQLSSKIQRSDQVGWGADGLTGLEHLYIQDAANNYMLGRNGLTQRQRLTGATAVFDAINSGQLNQVSSTSSDVLSQYTSGVEGLQEYVDIAKEVEYAGDGWENYSDKLAEAGKSVKQMTDKQREINKAISDGETDLKKSGDYADEYAASLKNLSKGGKSAAQELAKLRSKTLDLEDSMTATQKGRGKSGKQLDKKTKELIAGFLGVDTKDIKKYTKEELNDVLDTMEESVNQEFNESVFAPVMTDAINDINASLEKGEIDYELDVKPIFNTDGTVDYSALISLLQRINSDTASTAASFAGKIADYLVKITTTNLENGGKKVSVDSTVSRLKGGGSGGSYNRSGGGGGGGKSAADKLVEEQKRTVAEVEHRIKMNQTAQQRANLDNDYESQLSLIYEEITLQRELEKVYENNIKALEAARAKTKEGTDDWKKYTDAIYEAQEAAANLANEIIEIQKKQLEVVLERQENRLSIAQHGLDMNSIAQQRANTANDFETQLSLVIEQIKAQQDLRRVLFENVRELKQLRDETDQGTEAWYERNKALQEAEKEYAQAAVDLENMLAERINIISEQQSLEDRPIEHKSTMRQAEISKYEALEQFDTSREFRLNALMDKRNQYDLNLQQIKQWEDEMYELEAQGLKGEKAWVQARDAKWALMEENAQTEAEMLQELVSIQREEQEEFKKAYERDIAQPKYRLNLYDTYSQIALGNENYDRYHEYNEAAITEHLNLAWEAEQRAAEALLEKQNMAADTPQSDLDAKDEEIRGYYLEAAQHRQQVQQLSGDNWEAVFKQFSNALADATRETKHLITAFSTVAEIYKDTGEWDEYRETLKAMNAESLGMMEINAEAIDAQEAIVEAAKREYEETGNGEPLRKAQETLNGLKEQQLTYIRDMYRRAKQIQESYIQEIEVAIKRLKVLPDTISQIMDLEATLAQREQSWTEFRDASQESINSNRMSSYLDVKEARRLIELLQGDTINDPGVRAETEAKLGSLAVTLQKSILDRDAKEREIEKSYITEVIQERDKRSVEPNYMTSIIQPWLNRYSKNGNEQDYRRLIEQQIAHQKELNQINIDMRNKLIANMGNMTPGTVEYESAQKELNAFNVAIQNGAAAVEDFIDSLNSSFLREILDEYGESIKNATMQSNIANGYSSLYFNAHEYGMGRDELQRMIAADQEFIAADDQEIADLRDQLLNNKDLTKAELKELRDQYYAAEERRESHKQSYYQHQVAYNDSFADEALYQTDQNRSNAEYRLKYAQTSYNLAKTHGTEEEQTAALEAYKAEMQAYQEVLQKNQDIMTKALGGMKKGTEGWTKLTKALQQNTLEMQQNAATLADLDLQSATRELDQLIESRNRDISALEDEVSHYQQWASYYQSAGLYEQANNALAQENAARERLNALLAESIELAGQYLQTLIETGSITIGSDPMWNYLAQITGWEKKQTSNTISMARNQNQAEDNSKAQRKSRKELYDYIHDEIKKRIQLERDMLDATVSIENTILDTIRERYRKEAELIEKNLEKQKEALNEEKNMLAKRLQMRKDAIDQQDRYEELGVLKAQLAAISTDTSRSKEARELAKQIEALERENAMSIADAELDVETNRIDDQINAIDEKIELDREKLEAYLEDANNFKGIVENLLNGSFEDLSDWLAKNNSEYRNSLDEGRKQMLQTWSDTWDQMKNIIRTYWDEVQQIINGGYSSFTAYMMQGNDYLSESQPGRAAKMDEYHDKWYGEEKAYREGSAPPYSSISSQYAGMSEEDKRSIFEKAKAMFPDLMDWDKLEATLIPLPRDESETIEIGAGRDEGFVSLLEDDFNAISKSLSSMVQNIGVGSDKLGAIFEKFQEKIVDDNGEYTEKSKENIKEFAENATNYMKSQLEAVIAAQEVIKATENEEANARIQQIREALETSIKTIVDSTGTINSDTANSLATIISTLQSHYINQEDSFASLKDIILQIEEGMTEEQKAKLETALNAYGVSVGQMQTDMEKSTDEMDKATKSIDEQIRDTLGEILSVLSGNSDKEVENGEKKNKSLIEQAQEINDRVDGGMYNVEQNVGWANGIITKAATDGASAVWQQVNAMAGQVERHTDDMWIQTDKAMDTIMKTIGVDPNSGAAGAIKLTMTEASNAIKSSAGTLDSAAASMGSAAQTIADLRYELSGLKTYVGDMAVQAIDDAIHDNYMKDPTDTKPEGYSFQDSLNLGDGASTDGRRTGIRNPLPTLTLNDDVPDGAPWLNNDTGKGGTNNGGSNGSGNGSGSGGGSGGGGNSGGGTTTKKATVHGYTLTVDGHPMQNTGYASQDAAYNAARSAIDHYFNGAPYTGKTLEKKRQAAMNTIKAYKHGGLVDYTGPAWVDGSFSRPEAFLSPIDTANIKALVDTLAHISLSPSMFSMPDYSNFGSTSNYGDINITINQAQLQTDADYEEVARKVGKAFTKQLSKKGINVGQYSF